MQETYKFYSRYHDINAMNNDMYFKQFPRILNDKFNPPYLKITFSSDMEEEVLSRSDEFIVDEKRIKHFPTKVIEVPCESTSFESVEVKKLFKEHEAVSFRFTKKGTILLDVSIYESIDIEKDYW
jgi:hypothetical protein